MADAFQRIIETLLLATGSGRAILILAAPDGGLAIRAEAVREGMKQIRHGGSPADLVKADALVSLGNGRDIVVQDDAGATAQMIAPILQGAQIAGIILVQQGSERRPWRAEDQDALRRAQADALAELEQLGGREPVAAADLRAAAVQAILDGLRTTLDVQRCTFRQPVQAAYEFPVTFESRADGVRALLGDFTIVQTGQPVIRKLLETRAQVVQDDCSVASSEPLFHTMLAHYGGMRAQIVTPFIVGDALKGVLSIHELRHTRVWTEADKALGAEAARLIGGLFEEGR